MEISQNNPDALNDMKIENNPGKDFLFFLWDLFKTFIIVFIIAFVIRYFIIQPFVVEGGSMMPNFVDREYLLVEKLSYMLGQPKRGDVVVFKYPANPSTNFIKRIIGLPGEKVEISNNTVKIFNNQYPDGVIIDEYKYLSRDIKTLPPENEILSTTLDQNSYFVMGDNREHSSDSREWGILPKENIIGRTWLTIKPLNRFGLHKHIKYDELSYQSIIRLAHQFKLTRDR